MSFLPRFRSIIASKKNIFTLRKARLRSLNHSKTNFFPSYPQVLLKTFCTKVKVNETKAKEEESKNVDESQKQKINQNVEQNEDEEEEEEDLVARPERELEDIDFDKEEVTFKSEDYYDPAFYEPGEGHIEEYSGGLRWHIKTLDGKEMVLEGKKDLATAMHFEEKGHELLEKEDNTASLVYFLASADLFKTLFGENDVRHIRNLLNVGSIYSDLKFFEDAEVELIQVARNLQIFHEDDPLRFEALKELGKLYSRMKNYSNAESALESSLKIIDLHPELDPDHIETSFVLEALSTLALKRNDYDRAAELSQRAIDVFEKEFGDSDPTTLRVVLNLAKVRNLQKKYEQAEKLLKRVYDNSSGTIHLVSLVELGLLYHDTEKYDRALEFYGKAEEVTKDLYGPNHPELGGLYLNMGQLFKATGKITKSQEMFLKALGIYDLREEKGFDLQRIAALEPLVEAMVSLGRMDKAYDYSTRWASLSLKALGENNPSTLKAKEFVKLLSTETQS